MNKSIKKAIALVMVCSMSISLFSGCKPAVKPSEESKEKGKTFGLAIKTLSNPFFVEVKEAMEAEIVKNNPNDKLITFDSLNDVNKEIANVEDMITQKFDAIFITSMDLEGTVPSVEKVMKQGIPCILIDSGIKDNSLATATVMSNNVQAGELAMEALAEAMGYEGALAVYENSLSAAVSDRMKGRDNVLAKYPKITVVNRQNGKGAIDLALEVVNNFLQANPEIKGIWTMNDPAAQGALAAIKGANKLGTIHVTGIDGSIKGKELIEAGELLGTAAQFPKQLGASAVDAAYKVLAGEQLAERDIKIDSVWINKDNINEYK